MKITKVIIQNPAFVEITNTCVKDENEYIRRK